MNKPASNTAPEVSLLDRLIDQDPDCSVDNVACNQLAAVRESMRRDLENLLNTRLTTAVDSQRFPELKRSILNYGLADFSQADMESDTDQQLFAAEIQRIIEIFDPRFGELSVQINKKGEDQERMLLLNIFATVQLETDLIIVNFQSRVDLLKKQLEPLQHG